MNLKTITIALTVLVFAVLATVLMQKGSYVSQAEENYQKRTESAYKGTLNVLNFIGESVETNKSLWLFSTDVLQNVKTSKQMAETEAKYFPTTKGANSLQRKTRRFEVTSAYYVTAYFNKVEEDKTTKVKSLADFVGLDISTLVGRAKIKSSDDDGEEGAEGEEAVEGAEGEAAEAAVEEAPAPAPKKAAKGKKKKGKKR